MFKIKKQEVEKLKKLTDIIDETLKPSINTKTGDSSTKTENNEDVRLEMNLNVSDENLVEEYLTEIYEDQRSMLFNETDSLNEETTEQYNFDVYVQSSFDEDNNDTIESTINSETDQDYNEDIDPKTYDATSQTDNITHLAERPQIISHEDSDHETKYTLEWLIFSPSPVTECTVKFRLYDEHDDESLNDTDNDDAWLFFTASVTQDGEATFVGKVTLEHLLPGQTYIVHIASKNAHQYNTFSEQFLFTTKGGDVKESSGHESTKYRKGSTTISPVLQRSSKKPFRKVNHSVSEISPSSAIRILSYNCLCLSLFFNILIKEII